MTEQRDQPDDEETLAEWLFFARKQHRRRATHTTRTINTNTQERNK